MTESLAAAFKKANARKVKFGGKAVYSLFQVHVREGDVVKITRLQTSKTRAQAIKLGVDRGEIRANGLLVPTAAIWSHTAPEHVSLEVVGRRVRTIDVWNAWSFEGVDSSWIGNAGMLVESVGNSHVLRCSDGLGEATFDDLVVRLEVSSRG